MSRARNVINIVNFVRQIDERTDIDLFQATVEEVRAVKAFGFPNTFLLQYDALIQPEYQRLFLENRDDSMELGIWLEVVAPLCEATGIPWESGLGFRWDWHVKPGFLMAYDQDQRRRLLDEVMEKFKQVFGYYPRTAGSWIIDSFSMDYLAEAYGMDAFAICRGSVGNRLLYPLGRILQSGLLSLQEEYADPGPRPGRNRSLFRCSGCWAVTRSTSMTTGSQAAIIWLTARRFRHWSRFGLAERIRTGWTGI